MTETALAPATTRANAKFRDPDVTADGARRAGVDLVALRTLWINTGTLCNVTCRNCYIESSPLNDALVYFTLGDLRPYLDEIAREKLPTEEIGFTGGEPFMNPEIIPLIEESLRRGFRVLVLTNAMAPMARLKAPLLALKERFGAGLALRVSLDHYGQSLHETERGPRSWAPAIDGLRWLADSGFTVHVAGRTRWGEGEDSLRRGYAALFAELGIGIDAGDPAALVLFPEMDGDAEVPEITEACWSILGVSPQDVMCATSRMVVRRKGADRPAVVSCTLLPYEAAFEMGHSLAEASGRVSLNHRHCARFCVLGGGSCSST
ncbi:MAG: radical SAM protein [Proteobacteria bacterium]|nr:radical SAM protein [Pseudomonadota bacterium]